MKKYQDGGKTGAQLKKEGMAMKAAGKAMKAKGAAMKSDALSKKAALKSTYTPGVRVGNQSMNSDGSMNYSMKTGGMVNSNAKVTASKVAKGRPAKSPEPKSASKVATGRVGGTSKAPKTATPKMKMGGTMKRKSC